MPLELFMGALLMAGLDNDADKQYALQLYHDYKGLFYKVALRYFDNCTQDVEDAVSDSVVYMCTYLQSVKQVPQNRLPAYMMAIIRHVCMNKLKEKNKTKMRLIGKDLSELQDSIATDEDIEDVVFSKLNASTLLESFFNTNVNTNMTQEECNHDFKPYTTGSYRYLWYDEEMHTKYEIFMEVCTKCGYNYRESYAEINKYSHTPGNTYCSGGVHVDPGKHTFYKKCTVCNGACSESITVTCPGGNGYAHVSPP